MPDKKSATLLLLLVKENGARFLTQFFFERVHMSMGHLLKKERSEKKKFVLTLAQKNKKGQQNPDNSLFFHTSAIVMV
jgi:hypothetical protein